MAHKAVAQSHVLHDAQGTLVVLILRGNEDLKTSLREASPRVFEHIAFYQNSGSILKFEVVLNDENGAGGFVPGDGFVEVIAADFQVCGSFGPAASAHHDVLPGGFQ